MLKKTFSNIYTHQSKYNFLRSYPFPYRAAVSISNDAEYMDFEFFDELMKFVNTDQVTKFGTGLGLRLTSSFFPFQTNDKSFGYFKDASRNAVVSNVGRRLEDYLDNKLIDCNHSFGDFDESDYFFERWHALKYLDTLQSKGWDIPCFTNHGGVQNRQNVGQGFEYHSGDKRNSAFYHSDLFPTSGVRYVWSDELYFEKISEEKALWIKAPSVDLLKEITLNDGQDILGVLRFRGTGNIAPNLSSFYYQLRQIDWPKFAKNNNSLVIYQHLGVLFKNFIKCESATIELAIKYKVIDAFRFLKKISDENTIWIAGFSDLLRYLEMHRDIQVDMLDSELSTTFNINSKMIDMSGLTLYCNPRKEIKIFLNGLSQDFIYNGPDETGKYSVMIPLKNSVNIW